MTHQLLVLRNPLAFVADVGIPMIFVTLPLMVCALVPVILVEVWVAKPLLGLTYGKSIRVLTAANIVSTLVGVPVAWVVMYGMELLVFIVGERFLGNGHGPVWKVTEVVLGSAWLENTDNLFWAIPVAALTLLIPSFFASWYIEARVVKKMVETDWPAIRAAVFKANLASYAFLFVAGCGWLIYSLARPPRY
jgi:hypothetical protein